MPTFLCVQIQPTTYYFTAKAFMYNRSLQAVTGCLNNLSFRSAFWLLWKNNDLFVLIGAAKGRVHWSQFDLACCGWCRFHYRQWWAYIWYWPAQCWSGHHPHTKCWFVKPHTEALSCHSLWCHRRCSSSPRVWDGKRDSGFGCWISGRVGTAGSAPPTSGWDPDQPCTPGTY